MRNIDELQKEFMQIITDQDDLTQEELKAIYHKTDDKMTAIMIAFQVGYVIGCERGRKEKNI